VNQGVWVIDASSLIQAKKVVAAANQWRLFKQLENMVEEGRLFFPKQVTAELEQARHIDTPEAWALAAGPNVTQAYDPENTFVQQVMAVAGDVVDPDAEKDPGDPYVLAQALELTNAGFEACVVTEDVVDHLPLRISMATACGQLNLRHCQLQEFLARIEFNGPPRQA